MRSGAAAKVRLETRTVHKKKIPKVSAEKVGVKKVAEHNKADRECRMVTPRNEWLIEGLRALSLLSACESKKLLAGLYVTEGQIPF
jgi:hypothetical protein